MTLRIIVLVAMGFSLHCQTLAQSSDNEDGLNWQSLETFLQTNVVLKSGDTISLMVENVPELTGEYSIDETGVVNLPLIGSVNAANQTPAKFSKTLEALYDGFYLVNPVITVEIAPKPIPPVDSTGSNLHTIEPNSKPDFKAEGTLGAGDKISVIVKNVPEVTGEYIVDEAGVIDMPYVGKVTARAQTPESFAQVLKKLYDKNYLVDPDITVTIFAARLPDKEIVTYTEPLIKPKLIIKRIIE